MLEKEIESKVTEYAKSLGILSYKFTSPSNKGVPDRIFISNRGAIFFIEFKSEGKKPTKLQESVINKMKDNGCFVYVVNSVKNGKSIINQYINNVGI